MSEQNDKVKLTGLWRNTTAKGDMYLSGNVGLSKMLVFKNGYKEEGTNDPDYYVFLAPKKKLENIKLPILSLKNLLTICRFE